MCPTALCVTSRLALCVRGIDKHLNCPDVCRARGPKFCNKAEHSIKICGTITPKELKEYSPAKENNTKTLSDAFKKWHAAIPMSARFPLEFFEQFVGNNDSFKNAFEAQLLAAQVPFCICKKSFKVRRLPPSAAMITQSACSVNVANQSIFGASLITGSHCTRLATCYDRSTQRELAVKSVSQSIDFAYR
ncbi:unnamed protein product [Dibothriocephalus latus]|uniref:Uncharacterized protein n=1 Tax=Dibothriocephalus latus TaxID=60516 RepID=A0A3P7Q7M3_DIBLA|nr:unnamed protein product [Dibothriocephalus latus]